MIKFFRQSYAIQYVVIALMAIALWIPAFISGKANVGLDEPGTPLFNLVDRILRGSSIVQHVLAFVLLILDALIFNSIMVKNQVVGKVSTMGAFVFILLMSPTLTQTSFYPFVFSVPFILLAIGNLFDSYLLPNPEMNLLKAGLLVAFASLCYFPSIILVLWMIIVLPVAKKGSLRLELIPVFGFIFVYFLYFVGVFLFGDFHALMLGYLDYFTAFHFSVEGFNMWNVILLALIIVPTVFLFLGSNKSGFEKTVSVRTKISTTLILTVFALLTLFLGDNILMNGLLFIVLSIVMSYIFSYIGNTGWANLYLALFMIIVFANLYFFKLL